MDSSFELRSISKGAAYSFAGKAAGGMLNYFFVLLLARFSNPAVVGLFFIAITIINILAILSRLGLGEGVLRFVSIYNSSNEHPKVKGTIVFSTLIVLLVSATLSLLMFLNAHILANLLNKPELEVLIKAFSLSLPFVALFKIFLSSFQAFHEIKYMALLEGLVLPASMVIIYLLLYSLRDKFIILGITYTFSYLLVCCAALLILDKFFKDRRLFAFEDYKALLAFSFPLTFVGLLALTNGQIDTLVLSWLGSAKEVGVFSIAFKLSLLCTAVLASINYVFSPIIANLHNQGDMRRLEKIFKVVTRWVFIISLPVYFILVVNSDSILRIFGAKYAMGAIPLIILCTGQLVNFSTGSVGIMLTMTGKNYLTLFNSILFVISNFVLDILLIPVFGVSGAAMGVAASLAIINVLRLSQVYHFLKIHPYSLRLSIPILAFGLMALFTFSLNMIFPRSIINTLIYSFLGLIIYSFLMIITLQEEDKEILEYMINGSMGKVKNLFSYNGD